MKEIMKWELKNLLRFPILEIIVVLAVFHLFSIDTSPIIHLSGGKDSLSISSFHSELGRVTYYIVLGNLIDSRIIVYIISSLLFTVSFAYELDTNLTKLYMSYPVKRRDYFISKFFAPLVVIFVIFLVFGMGFAGFLDKSYFFIIPFSHFVLVYMLALFLLVFFTSAVCTTVSLLSKNTALSFIGSFFSLYMIDTIAKNTVGSPLFFLRDIQDKLLVSVHSQFYNGKIIYDFPYIEVIKTVYTPLFISLVLLLISFVYYTMYFEVK